MFAVQAYLMIGDWRRNVLSIDENVEQALTHFRGNFQYLNSCWSYKKLNRDALRTHIRRVETRTRKKKKRDNQ